MIKTHKFCGVLVVIILLSISIGICSASWLPTHYHRIEIDIDGSVGAGENYQVKLFIGKSSGGDFNLSGDDNFPYDIRFTDDDGVTLLDYWIENLEVDPVAVWVEVKDNLDDDATIYCYYDCDIDISTSNGSATFNLFDNMSSDTDSLWSMATSSNRDYFTRQLTTTLSSGGRLNYTAKLQNIDARNWAGGTTIGLSLLSGTSAFSDDWTGLYTNINSDNGATETTPILTTYSRDGGSEESSTSTGISEGNTYSFETIFTTSNSTTEIVNATGAVVYTKTLSTHIPDSVDYVVIYHNNEDSCNSNELKWYSGPPNYLRSYSIGAHQVPVCEGIVDYRIYTLFVSEYVSPEPAFLGASAPEANPTLPAGDCYVFNPYTEEGIPYVCVCIPSLGVCEYTDSFGSYDFAGLADGTYTVKACTGQFQCVTQLITVSDGNLSNCTITMTHEREMADASDHVELLDESAFELLMDSLGIPFWSGKFGAYNESEHPWTWGENECANVSNSTFYEFNFSIFAYAIALPFTQIMGNLFFLFLFGIPFLMMWLRQESSYVPLALGIILAAGIFALLPPEYVISAMGIMALSITAAIYVVFKDRS